MAGVGVARSVPSVLSFEERKPRAPRPSLFVLSGRKTWSDAFFCRSRDPNFYIFRDRRAPLPSSTGTLGVARGLRAFPFALDSTGWLSALRKSVSIAAVLRPWPRPHPRTIGFLGFQPIDFAERRVRCRRETRDARRAGARSGRTRRAWSHRPRRDRVVPSSSASRGTNRVIPRSSRAPSSEKYSHQP